MKNLQSSDEIVLFVKTRQNMLFSQNLLENKKRKKNETAVAVRFFYNLALELM